MADGIRRPSLFAFAALAACALFAVAALAIPTPQGAVTGVAHDASGNALPGIVVGVYD